MGQRIYRFFYWLFGMDLFLAGLKSLEAIADRERCRICNERPVEMCGCCEKCYIEEGEDSEEPYE